MLSIPLEEQDIDEPLRILLKKVNYFNKKYQQISSS